MRQIVLGLAVLCLLKAVPEAFGQVANPSPEDAQRRAAIADFTRRMREANFPALFDQASQEFRVPADILKGVAFAETRWEHLTWPAGQTASPETGMPRPYGIMSLWDNDHFGHSLREASQLIDQDPEVLKRDVLQNIRGASALLRRIYDQTERPAGFAEDALESWRYAIRKYCGIPEPDLNARHALDVYTFISQGYHGFGIEWEGHAVDLQAISEETRRIVQEEQRKRQTSAPANSSPSSLAYVSGATRTGLTLVPEAPVKMLPKAQAAAEATVSTRPKRWILWLLAGFGVIIIAGLILWRARSSARNCSGVKTKNP